VTDIMGEIAAASEEQSSGIEQVARAVTQMDEVTQQNAALVEEAAAAAQSLEDQAAKLREAVAVFHLNDDGSVVVGAARTAPRNVSSPGAAKFRPSVALKAKRATPAKPVAAAGRPLAAAGGDWETF
jgi:methyl-accepting chemotaxis protein-1 (serine sensor receptor)